ncbi:unnamed protein product [Sympodiomycopsis kandeliae]
MTSEFSSFHVTAGFTGSRPRFSPQKLQTILIANRGEIALRLIRTCKALSLKTVSVYSTVDEGAPHTFAADISVHLPGKEVDGKGYLDKEAIVQACLQHKVQAVLPGYGFLSENAEFATALEKAGIILCGPRAWTMAGFGLKHLARQLAEKAKVPCVPGTGLLSTYQEALSAAKDIGFPIMLKSSAGGGGMGLQVCHSADEVQEAFTSVTSRGKALFGSSEVFMEKYVQNARHVEVQIFGNGIGDCITFNERECSIQRRNQKVIEEAPSPFVSTRPELRKELTEAAARLGSLVKYKSAGTVEMLVDDDTSKFYFLETNVRLQVEHCVTEETHDIDLVALMLMQAEYEAQNKGGGIPAKQLQDLQCQPKGWAIEARLYAEDPIRNYAPSPGILQNIAFADETPGRRVDGWVKTGTNVTASYDPLLAKLIGSGDNRDAARQSLLALLQESKVQGPATNLELLQQVLAAEPYRQGATLISFLTSSTFKYQPRAFEVLEAGLSTSVQDFPARRNVLKGIPEAGPLDSFSFRIANLLVGNEQGVEGLEITMTGPTLKFHAPAVVALVGAEFEMSIDDKEVPTWARLFVPAGSILEIGSLRPDAVGCRAYLAIKGGLPSVAEWIGSKSTSAAIGVGGHQGRNLLPGDTLGLSVVSPEDATAKELPIIPVDKRWSFGINKNKGGSVTWDLCAMPGPFDDDAFLTADDRDKLYHQEWKVSPQAARSGIRFDAPLLKWARNDGGEGGSHPSNMLEFSYTPFGINWNGTVPVLLGPDGPDLGGLTITHTVLSSEFRAGQLSPGDSVRFQTMTFPEAKERLQKQEEYLTAVKRFAASGNNTDLMGMPGLQIDTAKAKENPPSLLKVIEGTSANRPRVEFRAGGDRAIVICFGEMTADIVHRVRIELLQRELDKLRQELGITAFSPNVRSLTIYLDPLTTDIENLVNTATSLEETLPPAEELQVKIRSWKLPVTFDDPKVADAVQRYRTTIRDKAIYVDTASKSPTDNKPYIVKCNGLSSIDDVISAVADTTYLATSVGFYFGTPILQPLDPRRRLRCQKYNPTRLWTPMGALGLGGTMGAIYGADSPGGYQLIARTLPGWRTYGEIPPFTPTQPWLLSDFDFVKFIPCNQEEYDKALASFLAGIYQFDVEYTTFDVKAQSEFLQSVKKEAKEFEAKQAKAMEECRLEEEKIFAEWKKEQDEKNSNKGSREAGNSSSYDYEADPNAVLVKATLAGSVWKIAVEEGQEVPKGTLSVILEAMKTEVNIRAPQTFKVKALLKPPGTQVSPGDVILAGTRCDA